MKPVPHIAPITEGVTKERVHRFLVNPETGDVLFDEPCRSYDAASGKWGCLTIVTVKRKTDGQIVGGASLLRQPSKTWPYSRKHGVNVARLRCLFALKTEGKEGDHKDFVLSPKVDWRVNAWELKGKKVKSHSYRPIQNIPDQIMEHWNHAS